MDVFYEESAMAKNTGKQARKWKILNVLSYAFLILAIVLAYNTIMWIPMDSAGQEGFAETLGIFILFLFNTLLVIAFWLFLTMWKNRTNVSYDYVFVTGELRITKVYQNKRKLLTKFDCKNILQLGDVESDSYERLRKDPSTQTIICTSNATTGTDKFYMYILANDSGKKLYVLECREVLLMHLLRFTGRGVLASDYVSQSKKQ